MSQTYEPECNNSFCQQPLKSEIEIRQGICISCQTPTVLIPPQINFKPERDRTEERHPEETFSSDPPKVRNFPLSGKNPSVPRNSNCSTCLGNIPPQQIDVCINCLAERSNLDETLPIFIKTLLYHFIVTETLPLIFNEV